MNTIIAMLFGIVLGMMIESFLEWKRYQRAMNNRLKEIEEEFDAEMNALERAIEDLEEEKCDAWWDQVSSEPDGPETTPWDEEIQRYG
jgi:F0F1-type ATP synthase membrane subunit b/b'